MQTTPNALRKHVALVGDVNAGKSTLFNALTGQDAAIVSPTPGTTTDPVRAAMELLPYGPIVLVDTAGGSDDTELSAQRRQKTQKAQRRADALLYVADAAAFNAEAYAAFADEKRDHLLVFTKGDCVAEKSLAALQKTFPAALVVEQDNEKSLAALRAALAALLAAQQPEDTPLFGDLLPAGSTVVMVVPVDSEAPKGRLILPQVQLLRDCLDHGITCHVTRETQLEGVLANLNRCDLVVTDSQAFSYVEARLPREMPLTSFSMLLARQKGNFAQLLAGAKALDTLTPGAKVLMLEGCTHNHTHEDIGRVKIPAALQKRAGKKLNYEYYNGYDFPEDLSGYHLAIQCGSCMLNRREVLARLEAMRAAHLPATNYGMALAWAGGILQRCCEVFENQVVAL